MKELNYKRAWSEYFHPQFLLLPDSMRDLYNHTAGESDSIFQVGAKQIVAGASPDLIDKFMAWATTDPALLARSAQIIYYLGHYATYKMWNNKGQHWKFEILAHTALIAARMQEHIYQEKARISKIIDGFMDHKEGSGYSDDEIPAILNQLPLTAFSVTDCRAVNFKPHPFCIGAGHFKDGTIDVDAAPCAIRGCNLKYSEHTNERVVFVQPKEGIDKDLIATDIKKCTEALYRHKIIIDGFAVVQEGKR